MRNEISQPVRYLSPAALYAELDTISLESQNALRSLNYLRNQADSDEPPLRQAARNSLGLLADLAATGAPLPVHAVSTSRTRRLLRTGRDVERIFDHLLGSIYRPRQIIRWLRTTWTVVGLLSAIGVALLIANQQFLWAAGLMAARVGGSLWIGDDDNLPFEGRTSNTRGIAVGTVYRCIAGHLTDAIVLLGVAWLLASLNRPNWAVIAAAVSVIALASTLFRVSALQVGVQINRLVIERVFRVGAMLLGLLLAGLLGTGGEIPLIFIAAAGTLGYAFTEIIRSVYWLRKASQRSKIRHVKVLFSDAGGPQTIRTVDDLAQRDDLDLVQRGQWAS